MSRMIAFLLPLAMILAHAPEKRDAKVSDKELFEKRIRPLLENHCLLCHGGAKVRGGLEVTSRAALLKGGEHGPAVVPGKPGRSLLLRAVGYKGDIRMPPRGKLKASQIADLTEWVRRGAPWPPGR